MGARKTNHKGEGHVKNGATAQAHELKKLAITKRQTKRIQTQSAMQSFGAAHMMPWFALTIPVSRIPGQHVQCRMAYAWPFFTSSSN
jgi:hypothetical protein